MATINSINNTSNPLASTAVTIDPGAAGDSYIQLSINGTGEFRIGVDDDAADTFKISQGSALGGTDTFVMSAAGERTMPLQPAFLAYLPSLVANATGNGATWTLGTTTALTEVYDQNGDFNTNGTLTAPVDGRYYMHVSYDVYPVTAAMTDGYLEIVTSNRTYTGSYMSPGVVMQAAGIIITGLSTFADMDAADTATFTITFSNGAGDTAGVNGSATPITYVCGSLIC